jgi:ubiquinol-cytochrome c reductase cytochrome b subunit
MLMRHIVLLPLGVTVIAGMHILLVRRRGIVPPFEEQVRVEAAATDSRGAEVPDERQ